MISCKDVKKSFAIGDRVVNALRGVDLSINEHGFYAIMGRSGSGKSTLLHMLSAMDRPDSGVVRVSGHEVHAMNEREATRFRREEIGVIFQAFNLIPTMTALENVQLPGLLAGRLSRKLADRSRELLDLLGLADRSDHRPEALSGGEQQRVAIARALCHRPPVLLADEPTGNLDDATADSVLALLQKLVRENGGTMLIATHSDTVASFCDRAVELHDGKLERSPNDPSAV